MKNPFKMLKADTSSAEELSSQLEQLNRTKQEAQALLLDLGARRPALLLEGSDAELATLDGSIRTAGVAIERATARIEVLESEWRRADQRETAEREAAASDALYKEATVAYRERQRLYTEYQTTAAALADKLKRIDAIDAIVFLANESRPINAAPIGSHFPGSRGTNSFLSRISLPAIFSEGLPFWEGKNAAGPALSAEQRFHLDYHAVK